MELKQLPQALDLEQAVLGAMMIDKDIPMDVFEILSPDDFYNCKNKSIAQIMFGMSERSQEIDLLTVSVEMKKKGMTGTDDIVYLTSLCNKIASPIHALRHARIVKEMSVKRGIIFNCTNAIDKCFQGSDDVFDIMDNVASFVDESMCQTSTTAPANIVDVSMEVLKSVKPEKGVKTGFRDLDKATGGWRNSDLIILGARPGMGKTALAMQLAINADCPVLISSIEMSNLQLSQRIVSSMSGVPLEKITKGQRTDQDNLSICEAIDLLHEKKIFSDEKASIPLMELRTKAKRMKSKHNIGLLIVDYLQLITTSYGDNREQQISYISRSLKALAKEINIPVIVLSQLSRACEARSDKRPLLSDLRESGAIEQDADMVMFLYRDSYYQKEVNYNDLDEAELIISKFRSGQPQVCRLHWLGQQVKFQDIDYIQRDTYIAHNTFFTNKHPN